MFLAHRDSQVVEPLEPVGTLDPKRGSDVEGKCRLIFRRHVQAVFGESLPSIGEQVHEYCLMVFCRAT